MHSDHPTTAETEHLRLSLHVGRGREELFSGNRMGKTSVLRK